jgi:transposase InsO family protein
MLRLATQGRATTTLALLAFLIPLPFQLPRPAPRTDPTAWRLLATGFQERGVSVVESHPRCGERDLYGLYVRGRQEVVVCPRGDRSLTLRHEGWHLVQSVCLMGTPWLPAETLEARLSRTDRRELQLLVSPEQRQREAEARVMAQLAPARYLEAMDQACAGRLPSGPIGEPLR